MDLLFLDDDPNRTSLFFSSQPSAWCVDTADKCINASILQIREKYGYGNVKGYAYTRDYVKNSIKVYRDGRFISEYTSADEKDWACERYGIDDWRGSESCQPSPERYEPIELEVGYLTSRPNPGPRK